MREGPSLCRGDCRKASGGGNSGRWDLGHISQIVKDLRMEVDASVNGFLQSQSRQLTEIINFTHCYFRVLTKGADFSHVSL